MRRSQTETGFTLVEVLIAMTLLGVMMALLFASLKISAESWEKSENKVSDISEIAATLNFFQRHLVNARPLWNDFNKEEKLFSFQGSKQSLQFVSAFPASAARAGLQLFSMELVNVDREQAIKVTLTPFYPPPEDEDWLKEDEILINHVESFTLAYFGREKGESDSRWVDQWLENDKLPSLVKIKIELENEIFWPEMIFELKMASSVDNAEPASDQSDNEDQDSAD